MRRRPAALPTVTVLAAVFVVAGTAPVAASTPTADGQEVTPVVDEDIPYFSPPLPPGSTIVADDAVLHVIA
jgi:hypothetical protein